MPPEKTETLTIRIPAEMKRQIEAAAQAERRSSSSLVEVAIEDYLKATGYIHSNLDADKFYNVRGRWLEMRDVSVPAPRGRFPSFFVTSPNEPGLIFGAKDVENALVMAQVMFEGVDYGREHPNKVEFDPPGFKRE